MALMVIESVCGQLAIGQVSATRDFYETNFHWLCWYDDVRAIMAASMTS
jgi:hypothetical protein